MTARSKNSQGLLGIPTVTFLHDFLHQYHAFPTEEDFFQLLGSCHLTATDIHVHRPQTFMFIDPNLTPLKPSLNNTCTFGQVFKNSCLFLFRCRKRQLLSNRFWIPLRIRMPSITEYAELAKNLLCGPRGRELFPGVFMHAVVEAHFVPIVQKLLYLRKEPEK